MPRMSVGDCSLYVERHGDGYPVMLVSGLGGLASYWQDQLKAFAKHFSVVTHDHRGVGQSDHVRMKYTVEKMAEDVIGIMDALEIEKAHIVGHSTGGAIAQVLAIEHPKRVGAMVIAASWPKPDAYFRRHFMMRREILQGLGPLAYIQNASLMLYPHAWIAENNEKLRGQEAQLVASFAPPEIMVSRIEAVMAFDRTADLGKIKAPTLVVGAADDNVTPAYYSEALARAIPNAELKMFPSGGHCFTQVMPRDFNQAVLPFLQANTPEER
ncbi:MAG TPA: pyrimidine utilization protein D [Aliidongia sp.]|nr:pyrimidine utilization protein D [Aliidongia sp.]